MTEEIRSYLKQPNPEFDSGFALFCRYSPNRILISSIGRRRDLDMLLYELRKLAGSGFARENPDAFVLQASSAPLPASPVPPENLQEQTAKARPVRFRTMDDRRTRRSDLPQELQLEYDANSADYSVRRAFHEKMKMAVTDADRSRFRSGIIECQERILARWKRIDDYLAAAAEASQTKAFNESSCRAYISKALRAKDLSDRRKAGVRARVKALLDHGCVISDATVQLLQERSLYAEESQP